jgi:hypothetical protein
MLLIFLNKILLPVYYQYFGGRRTSILMQFGFYRKILSRGEKIRDITSQHSSEILPSSIYYFLLTSEKLKQPLSLCGEMLLLFAYNWRYYEDPNWICTH